MPRPPTPAHEKRVPLNTTIGPEAQKVLDELLKKYRRQKKPNLVHAAIVFYGKQAQALGIDGDGDPIDPVWFEDALRAIHQKIAKEGTPEPVPKKRSG